MASIQAQPQLLSLSGPDHPSDHVWQPNHASQSGRFSQSRHIVIAIPHSLSVGSPHVPNLAGHTGACILLPHTCKAPDGSMRLSKPHPSGHLRQCVNRPGHACLGNAPTSPVGNRSTVSTLACQPCVCTHGLALLSTLRVCSVTLTASTMRVWPQVSPACSRISGLALGHLVTMIKKSTILHHCAQCAASGLGCVEVSSVVHIATPFRQPAYHPPFLP